MEIIFGTQATDALKLLHHRTLRLGIQHRHALAPADPRPSEPVTVTAWVGTDTDVTALSCYFTTGDFDPAGAYGESSTSHVVRFRQVGTEWDSVSWGFLTRWEATLPGQASGTIVRYRIGGWNEGSARSHEIFADSPNVTEISESASHSWSHHRDWSMPQAYETQTGNVFAYRVDDGAAPAWARDAVIYQVLVDRFYPGDGRDWLQTHDVGQLMGGTLWGVRDRLGYLTDLGITTLWLSPTWVSASPHGYDGIDFLNTADHLGGDAALHALVDSAHRVGVRILLDLPCNHVSNHHPIFLDALSSPSSPYRDWFVWDDPVNGYKAFFGVASMPKVNLQNPAARDWMVSIGAYWLREFDVDGYRLDYAVGPGPDFWAYFGGACKAARPDCVLLGEIVDTPGAQHAYIGKLDGCLDFYISEALRSTYGWKTKSVAEFERQAARRQAFFPSDLILPTFIDNHDMDRFLYIARGDKDALRAALAAQMRLPSPPILYYGTEVGLSHSVSSREVGLEIGRVPMVWDERQDRVLLADVADLIHGRTRG